MTRGDITLRHTSTMEAKIICSICRAELVADTYSVYGELVIRVSICEECMINAIERWKNNEQVS